MSDLGVMARFAGEAELVRAIKHFNRDGYQPMEASMPYESDAVLDALGGGSSTIPTLAFCVAIAAGVSAWWIQWWTRTTSMPLDVGGRPLGSSWADLPIVFETTILGAGIAAFLSFLLRSGLPKLRHAWFAVDGFDRGGGWWLAMHAPLPAEVGRRLASLNALAVLPLTDPDSEEEDEP